MSVQKMFRQDSVGKFGILPCFCNVDSLLDCFAVCWRIDFHLFASEKTWTASTKKSKQEKTKNKQRPERTNARQENQDRRIVNCCWPGITAYFTSTKDVEYR